MRRRIGYQGRKLRQSRLTGKKYGAAICGFGGRSLRVWVSLRSSVKEEQTAGIL